MKNSNNDNDLISNSMNINNPFDAPKDKYEKLYHELLKVNRKEEPKFLKDLILRMKEYSNEYIVIVGNDHSSFDPLILWEKGYDDKEPFVLNIGNMQSVSDQAIFKFNDYEYDRLIKYIKTLPDGEYQARVAEHGKTEVKGE